MPLRIRLLSFVTYLQLPDFQEQSYGHDIVSAARILFRISSITARIVP